MILIFILGLVALRILYSVGEVYYERDWPRDTWKGLLIALGVLCIAVSAFGQAARVDLPLLTAGPSVPISGGPLPQALWVANAAAYLCTHPSATLVACQAAPITTYTDSTEGTTCPTATPLVQLPGNTCTASTGTAANVGFWYGGGVFDYWIVSSYGTYGPFSGNSSNSALPSSCGNPIGIPCGGTGATTAAGALTSLGAAALSGAAFTGPVSGTSASFSGTVAAGTSISAPNLPIDVRTYGAACDGVTDDRIAIQAALTAAGVQASTTGQASVSIPFGSICLVNSNPNAATNWNIVETLPSGVGITGYGTVKIGNGINFATLFGYAAGTVITPATFENITIDFNGANNPMLSAPTNANVRIAFGNNLGTTNGSYGLVFRNLTFKNGNGVWTINTNNTDNSVIDGNHWINWGINSTINYDSSLVYTNGPNGGATITNNDFTATGPAVRTAIEVHNNNQVVTGNRIYGFGVGIIYAAQPYTTGQTSSMITISDNVIYAQLQGIQLWTSLGAIDNIVVGHNSITMDRQGLVTNTPVNGDEQGIGWYGNGGGYSLSHALIDGNTITWNPETATFPAPYFLAGIGLTTATASTAVIVDSEVSNNIVSNSPGACYWFNPVAIKGMHVHDNIAANCDTGTPKLTGVLGSAYTFQLPTGGTVASLLVNNNLAYDNQPVVTTADGINWSGAVGDGAPSGAQIVDNALVGKGFVNAYASFYNSGPFVRVSAPNAFLGNVNPGGSTSGNYSPIGSSITDTVTGITYYNQNTNGLTWAGPHFSGGVTFTQGTGASAATLSGSVPLTVNGWGFTWPSYNWYGQSLVAITPGTQAWGVATLSSGTVTVSNTAACTPSAASCSYKLTNCGINGSTGIGTLSLGVVSAGTSFVINSRGPTAAVLTTDVSTVCWQIN